VSWEYVSVRRDHRGQAELEDRASLSAVPGRQVAAVLARDLERDRETQARAHGSCGKEGIEDLLLHLLRNARAAVRHHHVDVAFLGTGPAQAGSYLHEAARGHRLERVDAQVEE